MDDIGRSLSWGALDSFLSKIKPDSAVARELNPELATWTTRAKTNAILADIFDLLNSINSNLVALGNGKKAKQTKKYPRPGQKDNSVRHFGDKKSAMPVAKFREWLEEKRKNDPRNKKVN